MYFKENIQNLIIKKKVIFAAFYLKELQKNKKFTSGQKPFLVILKTNPSNLAIKSVKV